MKHFDCISYTKKNLQKSIQTLSNSSLRSPKLSKTNDNDRVELGYPDKRDAQSKLPAKHPFQL